MQSLMLDYSQAKFVRVYFEAGWGVRSAQEAENQHLVQFAFTHVRT